MVQNWYKVADARLDALSAEGWGVRLPQSIVGATRVWILSTVCSKPLLAAGWLTPASALLRMRSPQHGHLGSLTWP